MKNNLIFLTFLFVFGVGATAQTTCNPPLNLTGTVNSPTWYDVTLNWDYPDSTNAPDRWLTWYNGTLYASFSLTNVIIVHRYDQDDLLPFNGKDLTQVRFYTRTSDTLAPGNLFTVNIYKGGSYASGVGFNPGTLVYSQPIAPDSVNVNGWTTVILDSVISIDATQEMWIGIQTGALPSRCYIDLSGVAEPMKGNVCLYNGNWVTLASSGSTYNWTIQGWVTGGTIVDGFNIYRDSVLQTPTPITSLSYLDLGISTGTHTYGVTTVYSADTCESAPATIQITMTQNPCETYVIDTYPWTEDFETEFWQSCITIVDADGDEYNWYRSTIDPHGGLYSANSASYESQTELTPNNYLILPPLLVPPSGARLNFWVAPQDPSYREEHYEVLISTMGTDTSDFSTSLFSETIAFDDWTQRTVEIAGEYAGQTVHIAFVHNECTNMFRMKIDDILIENMGGCITPGDVTANNITNASAEVGWTENGNATAWNLEFGITGYTQGEGTLLSVSTNPFTLSGLSPHTTYDLYVQSDCGVDGTSQWVMGRLTTGFESLHYETFEDYNAGDKIAAAANAMGRTYWTTWSGALGGSEDAVVSNAQADEGVNSMEVAYNNDCVLLFPKTLSGTHTVEADFYLPAGKVGYFNLLQNFGATSNWGIEIYFNAASAGVINAGAENAATFSFPYNEWFHLKFIINLDSDLAEFYVTDSLCFSWQWSLGANGTDGVNSLHAMDFYGHAALSQYYVDNIDYDYVTGVNENVIGQNLILYPNPASTQLHIIGTAGYNSIEIINFTGQVVYVNNNHDNQIDINIANLSSGLYFIRLKGEQGIITQKFVKK